MKVPHSHRRFAPPTVLVKLRLRVGRSGVRMSAGRDTLLCFKKSRPALGPTERHIQSVPGFFPGNKAAGVMLTTQSHLVPRLRMGAATSVLPHCACMAWTGVNLRVLLLLQY